MSLLLVARSFLVGQQEIIQDHHQQKYEQWDVDRHDIDVAGIFMLTTRTMGVKAVTTHFPPPYLGCGQP